MSWEQLTAPGITWTPSAVESTRFGLDIHRLTVGAGAVDRTKFVHSINLSPADIIIARYDASRHGIPGLLAATRRAVIPAGTLLYWDKATSLPSDPQPADETSTRVFPFTDFDLDVARDTVRSVVRASFADYGNHYTVDPLLDRQAALAGYEEWALSSLSDDRGNALIQTFDGLPVGVATLQQSEGHTEILLAGLIPEYQGRGLYTELLAAAELASCTAGSTRLVISTQAQNTRVQRAWARHGLRPFAAVETMHLVDRSALTAVLDL